MFFFLLLFFPYIIGSIPIGWLIARALGVRDIKTVGSGNIGATNVARVCGFQWFLVVFLLDALKAYFCLVFSSFFITSSDKLLLIAMAILIGNSFSLFLQFRGGKGVATIVGLLLFLQPMILLVLLITWSISLLVFNTVGIASVCMILFFPVISVVNGCSFSFLFFSIGVTGLIVWLHRKNISRFLLTGKKRIE